MTNRYPFFPTENNEQMSNKGGWTPTSISYWVCTLPKTNNSPTKNGGNFQVWNLQTSREKLIFRGENVQHQLHGVASTEPISPEIIGWNMESLQLDGFLYFMYIEYDLCSIYIYKISMDSSSNYPPPSEILYTTDVIGHGAFRAHGSFWWVSIKFRFKFQEGSNDQSNIPSTQINDFTHKNWFSTCLLPKKQFFFLCFSFWKICGCATICLGGHSKHLCPFLCHIPFVPPKGPLFFHPGNYDPWTKVSLSYGICMVNWPWRRSNWDRTQWISSSLTSKTGTVEQTL